MRIAALYDIHANLPALEAVLADVRASAVDHIVIGGDVVPGPMPCESLSMLCDSGVPTDFIHGNGELAVLAQIGVTDAAQVSYWGTTSGEPLPESLRPIVKWNADQIDRRYDAILRQWPATIRIAVEGLGTVLFCHGTPRSETECFTRLTPEQQLAPLFGPLDARMVVCGHTHMPFDRTIAGVRVINAGSVGMPFGSLDAQWIIVGSVVEFRRTPYDVNAAADRIRHTAYPQAAEFAAGLLQPPSEAAMLDAFTSASFQ